MTALQTAQKIGYQQAFKAITAGLVIAYVLMASFAQDILWLVTFRYALTLVFAALVLYGVGYLVGQRSGIYIIVKKYPAVLVGMISGFLMLGTATFTGGLIGFFREGLSSEFQRAYAFYDYLIKPVLTVWAYGFFPILAIGIWYGWSVKRRSCRIQSTETS
ncbi:MAG: hypothetical protein EOP52_11825 [Sphingobacteriales bacterium]|nr:MAG: hypothetical protein EOP52_11825 [Sphingobacteriales bacterium]